MGQLVLITVHRFHQLLNNVAGFRVVLPSV